MTYPLVRLDECTRIVSGATPSTNKSDYWNGDIRWVTPADLGNLDGPFISETPRTITEAGLANCAAEILPAYSVLFSSRAPIGHVAINTAPMATNQGFKSFVPSPDRLDATYLYHWLRANRKYLESQGNGATFKEVSKSVVARIEIPLPPIVEQRRIATILDSADALRRKRREALRRLQNLGRIIFLEMFGDPIANHRQWKTSRLGEVGTLDRGVSKHRPRNDPILLGGPYPLIQTGDISNCDGYVRTYTATYSEQGLHQSKLWPTGTLCITIAANIGNTGILTFDACFPDSIVGFVPGANVLTEFIQHWFSFVQPGLEKDAPQFAQKNINLAILRALEVPIPPLGMQQAFVARVAEIDEIKGYQRAHLAKLEALFVALQHHAFKGDL